MNKQPLVSIIMNCYNGQEYLREALNSYLKPSPIAIINANSKSTDFHARFSAKSRHYEYKIINRRQPLTVDKNLYWRVGKPLNVNLMIKASKYLIGTHDFTTYRSIKCQSKSPSKTLDKIDISKLGDKISFKFSAKSFLHNQLRSIVGSLKFVGEGKWDPKIIKDILNAKDRKRCGPTAPAKGLYLMNVDY